MEKPDSEDLCPQCGAPLSGDAAVCHRCLLKQAMEGPATISAEDYANEAGELEIDQIGPYRLIEKIGEGGMGQVYIAQQRQPFRRRVALKVIKPGMDSREVLSRFEAERQAIALMDHANIARVYDAGTTAEGRPYFVMELVEGRPLTEFCDQRKLSLNQRLDLFRQVCHAVQHAHQKGIIHRDLKPSNILVTTDAEKSDLPIPKIIDFGVAKALGPGLTEHTLMTLSGQVIGTPQYMSPEQAMLDATDVDTRADIYSLGVLLYELLTGRTPLEMAQLRQAGLDAVLKTIRDEEAPRPSTRLAKLENQTQTTIAEARRIPTSKLTQMLRGELDWIVMKALEKERSRRYDTANAFAADIGRYQNNEAVYASPPSQAYKLKKFLARNRAVVTTLVLVFGSVVAGGGIAAWQALEARTAQAKAEAEREKSEELVDFMTFDLKEKLEMVGRSSLLEDTVEAIEVYYEDRGDDLSGREQERRAAVFQTKGEILLALGKFEEAWDAIESSRAMWRTIRESHPNPDQWVAAETRSCRFLAEIAGIRGEVKRQEMLLGEGLSILESVSGAGLEDLELIMEEADLRMELLERSGGGSEGTVQLERARDILKKEYEKDPGNQDVARRYAYAIGRTATWHLYELSKEEVFELLDRAGQIIEELLVGDELNVQNLVAEARLLARRCFVFERIGLYEEGLEYARRAYPIIERLRELDPYNEDLANDLINVHLYHSYILKTDGRREEAATHYEETKLIAEEFLERFPHHPDWRAHLAHAYYRLGDMHRDLSVKVDLLNQSMEIRKALAREFPDTTEHAGWMMTLHGYLAGPLSGLGRHEEAIFHARASLGDPDEPISRMSGYNRLKLGGVYKKNDQFAEAGKVIAEAVEIFRRLRPEHFVYKPYWDSTHGLMVYLDILRREQRWEDGYAICRELVSVREQMVEHDPENFDKRLDVYNVYKSEAAWLRYLDRESDRVETLVKAARFWKTSADEFPDRDDFLSWHVRSSCEVIRMLTDEEGREEQAYRIAGDALKSLAKIRSIDSLSESRRQGFLAELRKLPERFRQIGDAKGEAGVYLEEILRVTARTQVDPESPSWLWELRTHCFEELAKVAVEQGDTGEARSLLR